MGQNPTLLVIGLVIGSLPPIILLLSIEQLHPGLLQATSSTRIAARTTRSTYGIINSEADHHHQYIMDGIADTDIHYRPSGPYQRRSKTKQESKPYAETQVESNSRRNDRSQDIDLVSSLDGIGLKHALYTAVLTSQSRVEEVSAAIMMSWGKYVSQIQFFHSTDGPPSRGSADRRVKPLTGVPTSKTFAPEHTLEALNYMCLTVPDDYFWYLLTTDTQYVNTDRLMQELERKSSSDSHIIGGIVDGQCHLERGLLLSVTAFQRFCTGVSRCGQGSPTTSLGTCLQAATGTACSSMEQVLTCSDNLQIFEEISTTHEMLDRHMKTVDEKITATKQKLTSLLSAIEKTSKSSLNIDIDSFITFNAVKVENNQNDNMVRPTHTMMETTMPAGKRHSPNMEVTPNKEVIPNMELNVTYSPYKDAKTLSDLTYKHLSSDSSMNNTATARFSFVSKTNDFANMFEFYYVEKGERGTEKVTQITIGQDIGSFEVIESEVVSPVPVNIVTHIDNATVADVEAFITMLHNACQYANDANLCNSTVLTIPSLNYIHLDQGIRKIYRDSINARMVYLPDNKLENLLEGNTVSGLLVFVPFNSIIDGSFLKRCQVNTKMGAESYFPIAWNINKEHECDTVFNNRCNELLDESDFSVVSIFLDDLKNRDIKDGFYNVYLDLMTHDNYTVNRYVDPGVSVTSQCK